MFRGGIVENRNPLKFLEWGTAVERKQEFRDLLSLQIAKWIEVRNPLEAQQTDDNWNMKLKSQDQTLKWNF
jgi:hypothetical protein